jgi:acetyl-CoA carboxylase carboxyltransferase component
LAIGEIAVMGPSGAIEVLYSKDIIGLKMQRKRLRLLLKKKQNTKKRLPILTKR